MRKIGCSIQQRLFVGKKWKVSITMIKQDSEICINIIFYTSDLLHLTHTVYGMPNLLCKCVWACTGTILHVSEEDL